MDEPRRRWESVLSRVEASIFARLASEAFLNSLYHSLFTVCLLCGQSQLLSDLAPQAVRVMLLSTDFDRCNQLDNSQDER
jgi:hypothetical protein